MKKWILFVIIAAPIFGQDVTMDLFPVANPQFVTSLDWNQQLFWVRVTNNENSPIQYRIVYKLRISNSPLISGTIMTGSTRVGTEQWDGENSQGYLAPNSGENVYNNDNSRIENLDIDLGFHAIVARSGLLPGGDYELTVELQAKLWNPNDDDELYFTDPDPVETIYHEWRIAVPMPPLLSLPVDKIIVNQTNPIFSWYSVQAAPGTKFLYNIRICLMEEGQSREEAMENLTHWTNDWDIELNHTGGQVNIIWTYPSEADPFAVGREYVWQVSTYNADGLYGWDAIEPSVSEIWLFSFGEEPKLISPSNGSIEPGMIPTFSWSASTGAMNYEIWISNREDPLVELPMWDAIITGVSYVYSMDAPQFIPLPSYPYYWKVRANPMEPVPGDWSEIYQFTVNSIEQVDPSDGGSVSSVLPTFYWNSPTALANIGLRVSDGDDDMVENPFFTEIVAANSFGYPDDAPSLSPAGRYVWKVIALDQNENILGDSEEYLTVYSFVVDPLVLNTPVQGSSVNSLTPLFTWESPSGVTEFEFQISGEQDPNLDNPEYRELMTRKNYQLNASEYLIEEGNIYYWNVIALDANGIILGNFEAYQPSEFSVEAIDYTSPVITVRISDEFPNIPTFSLAAGVDDADGYTITVATIEEIIWVSEILTSFPFTLSSEEVSLDYGTEYQVMGQAFQNGEPIGELGGVFNFTTGEKPGSNEQPEITISF